MKKFLFCVALITSIVSCSSNSSSTESTSTDSTVVDTAKHAVVDSIPKVNIKAIDSVKK
jgi:hypothetical protein